MTPGIYLFAMGTALAGVQGSAEQQIDVLSLEECMRDTEQLVQIVKLANKELRGRSGSFDASQVMSLLKRISQDLDLHQEGALSPLGTVFNGGVTLLFQALKSVSLGGAVGSGNMAHASVQRLLAGQQSHTLCSFCVI